MRHRLDRLDRLIGLIYESSVDPRLWSQALVAFSAATDGVGAHVVVVDKALRRPVSAVIGTRGMDPQFMEPYLRHYASLDPALRFAPFLPTGNSMICTDYFTEDFVRRSEFHQDFLLRVGGRFQAGWMLVNDDRHVIALDLHRRAAPFEREEAIHWGRIAGHFARAARLAIRLEVLSARGEATVVAGDRAGLAWLLVDGSARVVDNSEAATRLLNSGALLIVGEGRVLKASDDAQTRRLRLFVAGVAAGRGGARCDCADGVGPWPASRRRPAASRRRAYSAPISPAARCCACASGQRRWF